MAAGASGFAALNQSSPSVFGVNQFGINLRANSAPNVGSDPIGPGVCTITPNYNIPNRFFFGSGDTLVTSNQSSDYRVYTVSYITNVANGQAPGIYDTTLSYICLANF